MDHRSRSGFHSRLSRGTALAGAKLVEKLGGDVVELAFIVNLPDVGGEKKIEKTKYTSYSICEFEGD